jgi:hypothetical protein
LGRLLLIQGDGASVKGRSGFLQFRSREAELYPKLLILGPLGQPTKGQEQQYENPD